MCASSATVRPRPGRRSPAADGGPDALLGSDVFHTVDRLPAGGLWLPATEHVGQYTPVQAEAGFDVLRPAGHGGVSRCRQ
jgi:hypothetical protein